MRTFNLRFTPDGQVAGWCSLLRSIGLLAPEPCGCPIYEGRTCSTCPFPGIAEVQSRYVVGKVQFKDFDTLCALLEKTFGAVERTADGSNGLVAHGYTGDSRDREIGQVAAVVRREHVGAASNDLPVRRNMDGTYSLIISQYDLGQLPIRLDWKGIHGMKEIEGRFQQHYGVEHVFRTLPKRGYVLTQTTSAEGEIRVRARKR